MKNGISFISIVIIFLSINVGCEPVGMQHSSGNNFIIKYDDYDYANNIGMVQLFVLEENKKKELENPVLQLDKSQRMLLNFDVFSQNFENFKAKYIHCDRNWKPSPLQDIQFLDQVNEFSQHEYLVSGNTIQPYVNYSFELPSPKISGNYIVQLFKMDNPNEILFTRRFLVVRNEVFVELSMSRSSDVGSRNANQQLELSFNYTNIPSSNPLSEFSVVLLQNHRWNNAKKDLKPTFANPATNKMDYFHLDEKMNFSGWNEFRFFDLRTMSVTSRGVKFIRKANDKILVDLQEDESRLKKHYTNQFRDINGRLLLRNNDSEKGLWQSDYARVNFILKSDSVRGEVYIYGKLTNWKLDSRSLMRYNSTLKQYEGELYLKQGYYDYTYFTKSQNLPTTYFEGNHFQTENEYEAIIYYRKQGNLNDEIVGYKKINSMNFGY